MTVTRNSLKKIENIIKYNKKIKTGRKTDKTPCFLLCKMENFIVQFSRNFWREIPGVTAERCCKVKLYSVYTAIIWDI